MKSPAEKPNPTDIVILSFQCYSLKPIILCCKMLRQLRGTVMILECCGSEAEVGSEAVA